MKKIGLVCNYYIINYGSALQCFATQKTVKEMGYDVKALQFPNIPTRNAKIQLALRLKIKQCFSPKAVAKKLQRTKNSNSNQYYIDIREKRRNKFEQFISENLDMTDNYNSLDEVRTAASQYDTIMLGSDQLLNPKDIIFGYHTLSFVPDNIKKISYAASFGLSKLPITVKGKASKELKRFDCFAARETRGAEMYKELTGKDVPVVVDPTMLISADEWSQIVAQESIVKEKYIYCYFIGENPLHREITNKLQEYTGYKIVSIRHIDEFIKDDESFGDIAVNEAGPKEFINLVSNAEYVLADSFHATIFSVLFHKKFFVLNRFVEGSAGSTNSRLESLLGKLGLEERRIGSLSELNEKYKDEIQYSAVDKTLNQWISDSKEYLKNALEN